MAGHYCPGSRVLIHSSSMTQRRLLGRLLEALLSDSSAQCVRTGGGGVSLGAFDFRLFLSRSERVIMDLLHLLRS